MYAPLRSGLDRFSRFARTLFAFCLLPGTLGAKDSGRGPVRWGGALVFLILLFCGCSSHVAAFAAPPDVAQYAYIGGYRGIYEFRVKPDGSLQPLRNGPVKGGKIREGFSLYKLLVDPQTRTVYGLSMENKIYSYAIGRTGRLSPRAVTPFADAAGEQVVLDSQEHFLYALDGDNGLAVFDVLNPRHIVKKQTVVIPAGIRNLVSGPRDHSLWLLGERDDRKGRPFGGVLFHYSLHHRAGHGRGRHFMDRLASYSIPVLPNVLAVAGSRLITASWGSSLTVFEAKGAAPLRIVSDQSLLKANAAHLPSSMVYRPAGSFLYITTYYGAQSARDPAPVSAVILCHLSGDGQISRQRETGEPVSNPRPYFDGTGRFLYVVSEEGMLDAYKIGPDGHLLRSGPRIKVPAPTGMVFAGVPN